MFLTAGYCGNFLVSVLPCNTISNDVRVSITSIISSISWSSQDKCLEVQPQDTNKLAVGSFKSFKGWGWGSQLHSWALTYTCTKAIHPKQRTEQLRIHHTLHSLLRKPVFHYILMIKISYNILKTIKYVLQELKSLLIVLVHWRASLR